MAERAFITQRKIGKGHVVVLGAQPFGDKAQNMVDALLTHCIELAGVPGKFEVSKGTIVAPRVDKNGKAFWIIVNMDGEGGSVKVPAGSVDSLSAKKLSDSKLIIPAYDWRAIYPKV